MTKKKPSSQRAESAFERATELQEKALSTLITAYEVELAELKAENERHRKNDELLTKLAIQCGASEYGGGATGGNAVKAIASYVKDLNELKRRVEANEPTPQELAHRAEVEHREEVSVAKATSIAIFDSLIFAISNWSNEGDTAPDFEMACQSVLFPTVYERVMNGDSEYYLEEVPLEAALDVVQSGRELIRDLREVCESGLTDPRAWEEWKGDVKRFWTEDALPRLYGGKAEEWATDQPLSLDEINEWRDQPAARALHFPLIFDGMELVEKHRDDIRERSGLPNFNRRQIETRLTASVV